MVGQMENPVVVLRQGIVGQRPMDGDVTAAAVVLSDRLAQLKQANPIFEAISFSPDVEAMMATTVS